MRICRSSRQYEEEEQNIQIPENFRNKFISQSDTDVKRCLGVQSVASHLPELIILKDTIRIITKVVLASVLPYPS